MGTYCDRCKKDGYVTTVGCLLGSTPEEDLCDGCYKYWKKEQSHSHKN